MSNEGIASTVYIPTSLSILPPKKCPTITNSPVKNMYVVIRSLFFSLSIFLFIVRYIPTSGPFTFTEAPNIPVRKPIIIPVKVLVFNFISFPKRLYELEKIKRIAKIITRFLSGSICKEYMPKGIPNTEPQNNGRRISFNPVALVRYATIPVAITDIIATNGIAVDKGRSSGKKAMEIADIPNPITSAPIPAPKKMRLINKICIY